jgi:signal transduction histidine kinase
MLAPVALERARSMSPLAIGAIAWYLIGGRTIGIEVTPVATLYGGATCLVMTMLWWAFVSGRLSPKSGHAALAVIWCLCVSTTVQAHLGSDSRAFDFFMMLEALCVCLFLQTRYAIALVLALDLAYAVVRSHATSDSGSGFLPAAAACNLLGVGLQIAFQRSELRAVMGQRRQRRIANARARQLAELDSLRRERAALAEQVAASQRIEATGTIAASLAHELNNLFASISLGGEMLARRAKQARREDYELIVSESTRGASLTSKLLEFSRSSAVPRVSQSIRNVVTEAAQLMSRMLPRTIELDVHVETDERIVVEPIQLSQVLLNLGLNASRALEEHGVVKLVAHRARFDDATKQGLELSADSYIEISVRDSGCGMDAATSKRAIEPFFTTQPMGNGAGLGLSTAWSIVRAHGGALTIDSTLGTGTVVRIFLPVDIASC